MDAPAVLSGKQKVNPLKMGRSPHLRSSTKHVANTTGAKPMPTVEIGHAIG